MPLVREDEVVGIFALNRPEPGLFAPAQVKLVQTFADQAAIAIDNVRLFDEVKTKTDDLSEALQQQTATADVLKVISRSAFDLQAVLDTLIASAVELVRRRQRRDLPSARATSFQVGGDAASADIAEHYLGRSTPATNRPLDSADGSVGQDRA